MSAAISNTASTVISKTTAMQMREGLIPVVFLMLLKSPTSERSSSMLVNMVEISDLISLRLMSCY